MNSQQFLILNAVILLVLIIWFLLGRRAGAIKPTQLRMKDGNGPASEGMSATIGSAVSPRGERKPDARSGQYSDAQKGRYSDPKFLKYLEEDPATVTPVKELNVLFNYNGHTWDAYEVLGIPAGENIVTVTKAYQALVVKSAPESHEFLETAFKAVLAKK